jgi:hypothetical protein
MENEMENEDEVYGPWELEGFVWPSLPTDTNVISEYNLRRYMEQVCFSNGGKMRTARLLELPYANLVAFINHGARPSAELLDSLQMYRATVYVVKQAKAED